MKKRISLFLLTLLAAMLCLTGFSAKSGTYVYDDGGYLSSSEEASLNQQIESLRDELKTDIIIVITNTPTAGDDARPEAEAACQQWVRATGGYDENGQVVLLYIDMSRRKLFVNEYNRENKFLLSDSDIDGIVSDVKAYLTKDSENFFGACRAFISGVEDGAKPGFFQTIWGWLTVALGGSGLVTGISVGAHKSRVKVSKRVYMDKESFTTLLEEDEFISTTYETHTIESSSTDSSAGSDGNHGGGSDF